MPVLAHRLMLDPEARYDNAGLEAAQVLEKVVRSVQPPMDRS